MTNKQHPITPSSELLQDWGGRFYDQQLTFDELVTEVYKAGADQELEACAEWTRQDSSPEDAASLRAARRPKAPSLNVDRNGLAAAIRALADQVVPSDAVEPRNSLPMAMECQRIRAEILAIATELEGQ